MFDIVNSSLVFWEVATLAVVAFLIVFLVLAVRFLVRANRDGGSGSRGILDERYASGEIDRGEYEQKRWDLGGACQGNLKAPRTPCNGRAA